MHCGGCGYENAIELARCPRCGISEETLAQRGPNPPPAKEHLEVKTEVHLQLATMAGVPVPEEPAPRVPVEEQLRAARPPASGRMVAGVSGALVTFAVGSFLGLALSSHGAPPAEEVALRSEAYPMRTAAHPIALPQSRAPLLSARERGRLEVLHTRQGNTGVTVGTAISVTCRGGKDVVGTLLAVRGGYVDVATRAGRVRLAEADILDATPD